MKKNLLTVFIVLFSLSAYAESNTNPFLHRKKVEVSINSNTPNKEIVEDSFIIKKFNRLQKKLNSNMSKLTREVKDGNSKALFILIFISFLYGVFHSVGPGHGKCVVCSYLLTDENSIKKGFILGNLVAVIHATSAILVASIIYFFIKGSYSLVSEDISRALSVSSYSLITILGLSLLFKNLVSLNKNEQSEHIHDHNCNHDNEEHIHDHNKASIEKSEKTDKSLFLTALSIGLLPCPGAITILLFSISIDFISIGILLAFFIALGMGLTISLTAVITIISRKKTLNLFSEKLIKKSSIEKILKLLSASFITVFGSIFLLSSLYK